MGFGNTVKDDFEEAPAAKVAGPAIDMTVEGFTSYLAKFDQKARIVFRKKDAPVYDNALEAVEFTERLVSGGISTILVVGLS